MKVVVQPIRALAKEPWRLPTKSHPSDAGFDLYADITDHIEETGKPHVWIEPQETLMVPCNFRIELPDGYEAQVRPRSGLAAKKGLTVLNSPGTVDQNYRGEIKVILHNAGSTATSIAQGDRIAQMVIKEVPMIELVEGEVSTDTDRSDAGFGSTGR